MRWGYAAVAAAPALVLAGIGVTHPDDLTVATAPWWTTLHIILVPLFPLLGAAVWFLVRGVPGVLGWTARVAAFGYVAFYTVLDVLAGIAGGELVGLRGDNEQAVTVEAIDAVGDIGRSLGQIGSWCFIVACVAASVALLVRRGQAALPGGILLLIGAVAFDSTHIYWPAGVVSMLLLAAGFAALAVRPADRTGSPAREDAGAAPAP